MKVYLGSRLAASLARMGFIGTDILIPGYDMVAKNRNREGGGVAVTCLVPVAFKGGGGGGENW